ncbi:MAG: DUF1508 domain-containing protein [Rubrobacteraceae bacterium]|nr:DUF1508 domain-containing protein [Rubrobacteraceae bacterium]
MAKFEVYQDEAGKWRWRLLADNNAVIAGSNESFDQHANAERAVVQVRRSVYAMGPTEREAFPKGAGVNDPAMPGAAKLAAAGGGFKIPPALAGLLRGLLLAILVGVISAATNYLSTAHIPEAYASYAAIVVLILRAIEGAIDQYKSRQG